MKPYINIDDKDAFVGRSRNTVIEVYTEGDTFTIEDEVYKVTLGEITVFADNTIDASSGEFSSIG
jgi:hypothetical protein